MEPILQMRKLGHRDRICPKSQQVCGRARFELRLPLSVILILLGGKCTLRTSEESWAEETNSIRFQSMVQALRNTRFQSRYRP